MRLLWNTLKLALAMARLGDAAFISDGIFRLQAEQQQTPWIAEPQNFDWSSISPNRQLNYTPCYEGFQCARLDVPLNWNTTSASNGARVAVAIIRLPAKVPTTHPNYGGAILVNPGGPGESGVDEVLERGRDIQTIVDGPKLPEDIDADDLSSKYFDIIGFDPRGVKNTTPRLQCFSDAFTQQLWLLSYQDFGVAWDTESSLGIEWARTMALGEACSSYGDDENIIRYINTPQVVEDMVEIIERHGEWREAQATKLMSSDAISLNRDQQVEIQERTKWKHEHEMLKYWGVSYGSILGQTFAAMHPDRVSRLVIDGILDAEDYYNGAWLSNLQDSDQAMRKLSEYCFEAGPKRCPLFTAGSAKDVQERVESVVARFKTDPIPVLGPDTGGQPQIVSFGDVYLYAIGAMAFPFALAEEVFALLAEMEMGNITRMASQKADQARTTASLAECSDADKSPDGCFPEQYFGLLSSTPMIECMDSFRSGNRNMSKEDFQFYYEQLTAQSKWFAASWARHKLSCIGMTDELAYQFEGPISGNTSYPMLIIGNTYDTQTPIRNARRTAELFPGSVVLQQDSEGHCSHSNPSLCTAKVVRRYFQTGELPEEGTVCEPEYRPFIGYSDGMQSLSETDGKLWKALLNLSRPRYPVAHSYQLSGRNEV